ncbi:dienelactone hydrolase family protein [Goodfellowiella coeruleoviolacea]|uniref:Dienelactone hydrolase n=1 Tax=Goodfellowiella coeruleoviolacea TaxID=334858 RepID=A0AAE3KJF9_9PSEU|nr:alpha/beta fold hydrolase [Goodfellowiella coeruleoviolacea]MCP2164258.1 Dienelactone hydrolase [Goodfellowiella coeruleoviolacea]
MTTPVSVETAGGDLAGDLVLPDSVRGVVVFAHGSGSSRHSSRNRAVAEILRQDGFAALLLDLLTAEEEERDIRTAELRFDIDLLATRVVAAIDQLDLWRPAHAWDAADPPPLGLFGASTGAAAALVAAAQRPDQVRAVVSRGGRPDLAGRALVRVRAPTLLIVGGRDEQVLDLNLRAGDALAAPHRLDVVPGATHLFPEPGALEEVARLAADWFGQHLVGRSAPARG